MKLVQRAWSTQRAVYRAMSSPDVFRSSPARPASQVVHVIGSSSPAFPEISELIDRAKSSKPPLKSGSKSIPVPDDAPSGFTTARDLWQARGAAQTPTGPLASDDVEVIDQEAGEASVCIVEEPEANVEARTRSSKPRARKSGTKKVSPPVQEVEPPTTPSRDQPWRKYKPSPRGHLSSPENFFIGADAPPSAQLPPEEHRLLETEVISKHFQPKRKAAVEPQDTSVESISICKSDTVPFVMEPAPIRRLNWTPPPPESRQLDLGEPSTVTSPGHTSPEQTSPVANEHTFKSLLESYECPQNVAHVSREPFVPEGGLGKRKLVEPVTVRAGSTSDRSRSVSPTKQKAPKKRPRTITELATAAYRVQEEELPPPAPSLLEYMTATTDAGKAETSQTKSKAKPRKRQTKTSKKKAGPPKPVLLSPAAALKHVAKQDFVFGTSSQLAQEKSPTFLRSLHTAMQQSNEAKDPVFGSPLNSDGVEPPERRPRLWDAAARDADGDLFDVKVIDLAGESPKLPAIVEETDPFGYVRTEGVAANSPLPAPVVITSDDSFMSLSDLLPTKAKKHATDQLAPDPTFRPVTKDTSTAVPHQDSNAPTFAEESLQSHSGGAIHAGAEHVQATNSVSWEAYTDTQLAEQVANRGLKPVKRRSTMIALLQKNSDTLDRPKTFKSPPQSRTLSMTAAASAASASRSRERPKKTTATEPSTGDPAPIIETPKPSKRPRGRPRKDEDSPAKPTPGRRKAKKDVSPTAKGKAKASAAVGGKTKTKPRPKTPVLEIADSASDDGGDLSRSASPSPDPTFSPSGGTELSVSAVDDTDLSMTIAPTDQQATLFGYITRIVTTTPRSTDADNPNWYEKMLLYDPIVVEDLAAWLNDGQLSAAGCESQVTPAEVKKWCESKSVCCVWSDSNRGKARKRY